jgi:hypothetical protein
MISRPIFLCSLTLSSLIDVSCLVEVGKDGLEDSKDLLLSILQDYVSDINKANDGGKVNSCKKGS